MEGQSLVANRRVPAPVALLQLQSRRISASARSCLCRNGKLEPCRQRLWTRPEHRMRRQARHGAGRYAAVAMAGAAAQNDYYQVLSVSSTASAAEIKQAFRKKALKLHPDVNSAPDAKERFMEAKEAFTALSDPQMRAAYDRQRQGFDWGGFARGMGASQAQQPGRASPKKPEEPFYGFSEFFRDVENEVGTRRSKAKQNRNPGTLLEELAAIGEDILEDFVEFLESELGLQPEEGSRSAAAAAAAAKESSNAAEKRRKDAAAASSRAEKQADAVQQDIITKAKNVEEEVDAMLIALKKKMGKL